MRREGLSVVSREGLSFVMRREGLSVVVKFCNEQRRVKFCGEEENNCHKELSTFCK